MKLRKFLIKYWLIIAIGIMIVTVATVGAVTEITDPKFDQDLTYFIIITVIKTIPTLGTLVVLLFQAQAKRIAFLMGAANAAIYGISYILMGLYFSATSALLISVPIPIFTFFSWKKNSTGKEVRFRTMKHWQLAGTIGIILAGWVACYFGLSKTGIMPPSNYPILDTLTFSIGIVVTVIVTFRFIESTYINAVSCLIGLVLHLLVALKDPTTFNYVVISCYNLFRISQACVNWTRQYLAQKRSAAAEPALK
jgi:nicotinamide mononucleotide transporter PnuC